MKILMRVSLLVLAIVIAGCTKKVDPISVPSDNGTTGSVPDAPILTSPANGATSIYMVSTLNWQAVSGAYYYIYQISMDSSFSKVIYEDSPYYYPYVTRTLNTPGQYFWRVKAANAYYYSDWSSTYTFTTIPNKVCSLSHLIIPDVLRNVSVSGGYAYIANDKYLKILDVRDPLTPSVAGQLSFQREVSDAVVYGNYCLVACEYDLRIIDVSNPAMPVQVGASTIYEVSDIATDGHYAYVVNDQSLVVIDISDPTNPVKCGQWNCGENLHCRYVALQGGYAYVQCGMVCVIDISNPAQPTQVGGIYTGNGEIAIQGNYAYVTGYGLNVIDINIPAQLSQVSQIGREYTYIEGIAVKENYAFVNTGFGGLAVYDITQPSQPVLADVYDQRYIGSKVALAGNVVYTLGYDKFWCLDITGFEKK